MYLISCTKSYKEWVVEWPIGQAINPLIWLYHQGHLPACILATVVAFLSQSGVTGICNLRS